MTSSIKRVVLCLTLQISHIKLQKHSIASETLTQFDKASRKNLTKFSRDTDVLIDSIIAVYKYVLILSKEIRSKNGVHWIIMNMIYIYL